MRAAMSSEAPQLKIRLPPELKGRIEASAKLSGRSINSEIVSRLRSTYADDETQDVATLLRAALSIVENSTAG
jgi:predicted HicB family RNase H-like nuclease